MWLLSECKTYGVKLHWKNIQGICGSCPGYLFLQWQKLLGFFVLQTTRNHSCSHFMADTAILCSSCSWLSLDVFALSVSGCSENKMDPSCCVPKGLGSWLLTQFFLSQWGELFQAKTFLLEECWPGVWDDAGKMQLLFLPFWVDILRLFVSLCCWSILSRLLSSPRTIFVRE